MVSENTLKNKSMNELNEYMSWSQFNKNFIRNLSIKEKNYYIKNKLQRKSIANHSFLRYEM